MTQGIKRRLSPAATATATTSWPEKSPADPRSYQYLRLANGLTALLVSDPDTSAAKSAAALSVGVGSLADPPSLPGAAHFLEHMVFMGSAAFPGENALDAFLSARGGSVNAFTDAELTVYHFETLTPTDLRPALEIFSHFFVAPLLRSDCLRREVEAVESEFRQALVSDAARREQLLLCDRLVAAAHAHPYRGFGFGNRQSLQTTPAANGVDVSAALRGFFDAHYSAARMRLCVVAPLPLDSLAAMVTDLFEAIPQRARPDDAIVPDAVAPFAGGPALLQVVPVKKGHRLLLDWHLPPVKALYRRKPHEYVAHLLGHEAEGSLAECLRAKGWASAVKAGVSGTGYANSSLLATFGVEVTLTDAGLRHWLDVVGDVRAYVAFLAALPTLPTWIYDELRQCAAMEWNFQEKKEAPDLAEDVVCRLQPCEGVAEADVLQADFLFDAFDEDEVRQVVSHLSQTSNLFVVLTSHAFRRLVAAEAGGDAGSEEDSEEGSGSDAGSEGDSEEGSGSDASDAETTSDADDGDASLDAAEIPLFPDSAALQTEPWFQTKYWQRQFPPGDPRVGDATQFHLPTPNVFLPTSFTVVASAAGAAAMAPRPPRGANDVLFVLNQLRTAPLPRVDLRLLLAPDGIECAPSVETVVRMKLLLALWAETLQAEMYKARLASIDWSADMDIQGVVLHFCGFSDTLFAFVSLVLERLAQLATQPRLAHHFALVQESLLRVFANEETRCKATAQRIRRQLLFGNVYARGEDKADVARRSSLDDVLALLPLLVQTTRAAALLVGNVDVDKATVPLSFLAAPQRLQLHVPQPQATRLTQKTLIVEEHGNANEPNCVVSLYLQFTGDDAVVRADLLYALMAEPLFDTLRTKQQLGYEVACAAREGGGSVGLEIWVQSAVAAPSTLLRHINDFVVDFHRQLAAMDATQFRSTALALAAQKREPPASLTEEAAQLWRDLLRDRVFFADLAAAQWLEHSATLDAIVAWYAEQVVSNPRRLVVVVIGAGTAWSRAVEEPLLRALL